MKRSFAGAIVVVLSACTTVSDEDAVRRFVRAWTEDRATLAATATGDDTDELLETISTLRVDGLDRADLVRTSSSGDRIHGVVSLRFTDGARLELNVRASVQDGRVVADPSTISTGLTEWERLTVERSGRPKRGRIRSRDGTVLARGEGSAAVTLMHNALAEQLEGTRGVRLLAGDRVLAEAEPVDGADVETSLDDRLQRIAEVSLGDDTGALVAVDPRTGGVRALAAQPQDATAAHAPGSTFKLVTAAAALESGVVTLSDRVPCPAHTSEWGRPIANFGTIAYGRITFERAFAVSCNTAFARVGVAVGTARLLRTARRLGFEVGDGDGQATISVPGSRSELALWSFGAQGSRISPLLMAGIGATIAHGGRRVTPGWTDHGNLGARALREATANDLVTMMEEVVETGTGRNASLDGVRVAGKTGTADPEASGEPSDAWFVGLAPSRRTELVVVAFLPRAGIGGQQAATLVRSFVAAAGVG